MKPSFLTLTAVLAAASLTACKDDQARLDVPEPASLAEMDALAGLPPAEPLDIRYVEPDVGYGYAERAYDLQRVFYDERPDYAFVYDDYEPWVWRTADDWEMYAEPWDDGYRYYYYEPGADYPYWIQDANYGYGFGPGGVLVSIVTVTGVYLSADRYVTYAPLAARYYLRGYQLHDAGRRARRIEVTDRVWRERAPKVMRNADPWIRTAPAAKQWKAWREKQGPRREVAFGTGRDAPGRGPRADRPTGPSLREARERPRHEVAQRPERPVHERGARREAVARGAEPKAMHGRPAHAMRPERPAFAAEQARPQPVHRAELRPQARGAEAQGRPAAAVAEPGPQQRGGAKAQGGQGQAKAQGGGNGAEHGQGGGHGKKGG